MFMSGVLFMLGMIAAAVAVRLAIEFHQIILGIIGIIGMLVLVTVAPGVVVAAAFLIVSVLLSALVARFVDARHATVSKFLWRLVGREPPSWVVKTR